MILSGSVGFPLIDTTIAIFELDMAKELKYNEIGEICKSGPGLMLGYPDKKMAEEVLKVHPDGKVWLHTGDFGYMTEEGLLYVLGRENFRDPEATAEAFDGDYFRTGDLGYIDGENYLHLTGRAALLSARPQRYQEYPCA